MEAESKAVLLFKILFCLQIEKICDDIIVDNTIWAGCAHGLSFFVLNALIAQCAGRRKVCIMLYLYVFITNISVAYVCMGPREQAPGKSAEMLWPHRT